MDPCSRHAPGRAARSPAPPAVIVVGVDGSVGAQAALDFAVAEAVLRGAALHVVHAWEYPPTYGDGWIQPDDEFGSNAAHVLNHAISLTREAAAERGPVPAMIAVLEHGDAAEKLLAAARDAILLVVGSRGHGGFVGILLGSVSRHCTLHSPCPVVVVRGHAAPDGPSWSVATSAPGRAASRE